MKAPTKTIPKKVEIKRRGCNNSFTHETSQLTPSEQQKIINAIKPYCTRIIGNHQTGILKFTLCGSSNLNTVKILEENIKRKTRNIKLEFKENI